MAACAVIAGCSAPSAPAGAADALGGGGKVQIFGPEERRAAQRLSIANTAALDNAASPYQEALLCAVSVDRLVARLRGASALNTEQLDVVQRLQVGFEQRAAQLKGEDDSIEADRLAITEDHSASELAQIALGCLQRSV